MVNRAAVLIRLKQPFVDWLNEVDPDSSGSPMTLDEANEDRTVYLIDEDEGEHVGQWIDLNYKQVLECELEDWVTDPDLWPQDVNRDLFNAWCEVECHTVIVDTVGGPIFEDDEEY